MTVTGWALVHGTARQKRMARNVRLLKQQVKDAENDEEAVACLEQMLRVQRSLAAEINPTFLTG
tara:strand:+ start:3393 stop:3584 length:192 start_codon:yes stop_codon:yes gene_type:complete